MALATAKSVLWFRKGLRLHDNPALHIACRDASHVYPLFILDPWFLRPDPSAPSPGSARVGINRIRFLLESLEDLDRSLKAKGSRLVLAHGDPKEVLPLIFDTWKITRLCFEHDTEPYALARDKAVKEAATAASVEVHCPVSHTIFDPEAVIKANGGKPPLTYQSFCKHLGRPGAAVGPAPELIPPIGPEAMFQTEGESAISKPFKETLKLLSGVPTLTSLGYTRSEMDEESMMPPFKGGEAEGLRRLEEMMSRKTWVAVFEKPKGDPSAFTNPATTVLSPYLKFGCVSSRLMYERVKEVYAEVKKHSQPPVSLEGQLLWREFFYTVGYGTPNFDKMEGSRMCRQIPWKDDDELLQRWRDGQTGFPWIDAIMMQLKTWGWMHHLARHCVACFLTRGDLFVHWEKGRDVFDRLLLDGDWSINNGNWLWLSASAFFSQYFRIYSPITFGKKYDPTGKFVRQFLPVLKDMPAMYIYEPWKAPIAVQKKANCIIGKDYPFPVVDHAEASKLCKDRMALAYGSNSAGASETDKEIGEGELYRSKKTKYGGEAKRAAKPQGKAAGSGSRARPVQTLEQGSASVELPAPTVKTETPEAKPRTSGRKRQKTMDEYH